MRFFSLYIGRKYKSIDEHERIISEKEKEEDFETNYSYYDNILSLLKTQKIGNQTIYYGYDSNNDRCISKSQSINNMDYSLIYGYTNDLLTQVNNNDDGLLSSSETDTIETNYSYNQNKLISQLTRNFADSNSFTYNYAYSYNQNPYLCTSYSYNNFIINYDYDLLERIKEKKRKLLIMVMYY